MTDSDVGSTHGALALNDAYLLLPNKFVEELRSFVSPDHDFALMYCDASPAEAVEMIQRALEWTEDKFDEDRTAWPKWWEAEREMGLRNAGLWRTAQAINSIFEIRDEIFWLPAENSADLDQGFPEPEHIMKAPERWQHYMNDRASAYFYLNRVVPNNNTQLREMAAPMALSPPLMLLEGVPPPNPVEVAGRIARRLTDPTNSLRGEFVVKLFNSDGPNYPFNFVETVAFQMSKELGGKKPAPTTVRDYLRKDGYTHPWDLTHVKKGKV